jgi:diadenosine tetraphosphatase ApaH/serine/threonine PP2A family protein phosphatase
MLGLLYDVHGNLPALDAVLEDAGDVDRWLLGGDYTLFGAWPVETTGRLRELDATWIRGNGERWTAAPSEAPEPVRAAVAWCAAQLGEDFVAVLGALPETWRAGDALYCHASPRSDVESFLPAPAADEADLLAGVPADVQLMVFGHTHLAFAREAAGGLKLANPGSVGMPLDGDHRAAYAVIGEGGQVEHRRVAYDHQASADAIRERIGEAGEQGARRIERAAFDAG